MKKTETEEGFNFDDMVSNNKPATYSILGSVNALLDKPKERAAIQNEIAKTQYGYLLGQGVGDPRKVKKSRVFK